MHFICSVFVSVLFCDIISCHSIFIGCLRRLCHFLSISFNLYPMPYKIVSLSGYPMYLYPMPKEILSFLGYLIFAFSVF